MEVPLPRGMVAVIDDADWPLINGFSWYAAMKHGTWYAVTRPPAGHPCGLITAQMHRLVLGHGRGQPHVDHRDGDGLNNRRSNLRVATPQENARNKHVRADSGTGIKGVYLTDEGRYRAKIFDGERRISLGRYATAEQAVEAYDTASRELFGEFAFVNRPAP